MGAATTVPGFHRRFKITPSDGCVSAAVEDDYHCMAVRMRHADGRIGSVEAVMDRAPWSTCPGALAQLRATFEGAELKDAVGVGEKKRNCTHLYDLALLCAAHADDDKELRYDIFVSDPVDGAMAAEIRRDGALSMRWKLAGDAIQSPTELAGKTLFTLRDWIAGLDPQRQEAARLLQWGAIIAHGRRIPLERQSDASRMPANCYTFQPEMAAKAKRVGRILDFSDGALSPLEHHERGVTFAARQT